MQGKIKTFYDFINETDVVGHDEVNATKPTALSESFCIKMRECMDMGLKEAAAWHKDKHKEHTAEGWVSECNTYLKECMDQLQQECTSFATQGDDYNRSDGGMRQGSVQDVPVM